ncbi:MAG: hypothetical protein WCC01_08240 [Acidimicrobiia bacterium]
MTTPPIRSYERMSVGGGTVVVVVAGAEVVVVVGAGLDGVVVVVVGAAAVVVVLLADGVVVVVVEDDASTVVVGTDEPDVEAVIVEVVGTIAAGVSVTWSRTLPTAAAATNTAVAVTASQTST